MYATGNRCASSLTATPGAPPHQLLHQQSLQPFSYRRVVNGCHDSSPPLSSAVGSQAIGGYRQDSNGCGNRSQQQQQQQLVSDHQTLGEFLPSSSAGSCRQTQQLSYTTRYHGQQQQQQTAFYDSPPSFDYSLGGPLGNGDHPNGQRSRSFCAIQSQQPMQTQPQPAHCGVRTTIGMHANVGSAPWVADQRPDAFRTTQNSTSEMTSSVRGGPVKEEFTDPSDCSSSDTYSDQDWASSRPGSASRSSRGFNESNNCGFEGQQNDSVQRSRTHNTTRSRRNGREIKLTPEEEERRRVRRERNKLAAARCRQRRVDLTNQLLAETESLEDEKLRLEKEISNLQRQRNQLEFVLEAHVPRCQVLATVGSAGLQPPAAHVQPPTATSAYNHLGPPMHLSVPSTQGSAVKVEKPDDFVAKATESGSVVSSSPSNVTTTARCRPASLSIKRSHIVSNDVTPGVFDSLGLDCMIDGHTGLTPITGAPSCGGSRVTPDDVTMNELSPTTLMTL